MTGSDIRIRASGGGQFNCYLALPDGGAKVPAVVLASAIHGVDGDIRAIADEFAAKGRALRAKMWPVYKKQIDTLFGKHLETREADLICTAFDRIIDSSNQRTIT